MVTEKKKAGFIFKNEDLTSSFSSGFQTFRPMHCEFKRGIKLQNAEILSKNNYSLCFYAPPSNPKKLAYLETGIVKPVIDTGSRVQTRTKFCTHSAFGNFC